MRLRRHMLALTLTACGAAAWAADTLTAQLQTPPVRTAPTLRSAPPLDQQVAALQQQVAVLQSQVNALLTVVRMTDTGVAGQGPAVVIAGHSVDIRSDTNLGMRASSNLIAESGMNTTLRSGITMTLMSGTTMTVQAQSSAELKAAIIRLNNGSKPVATLGSTVQMQPNGTGQIVNGATTVFIE